MVPSFLPGFSGAWTTHLLSKLTFNCLGLLLLNKMLKIKTVGSLGKKVLAPKGRQKVERLPTFVLIDIGSSVVALLDVFCFSVSCFGYVLVDKKLLGSEDGLKVDECFDEPLMENVDEKVDVIAKEGSRFIGATEAVAMNTPPVVGAATRRKTMELNHRWCCHRRVSSDAPGIMVGGSLGSFRWRFVGPDSKGGTYFNTVISAQQPQPVVIEEVPQVELERSSASSPSWFGGLFGGMREEEKPKLKVEVLENFDSPMPPTFEFQ
ncbi:hypothetical protein Hanom_Chr03g00247641 [Helianthus anomalus]